MNFHDGIPVRFVPFFLAVVCLLGLTPALILAPPAEDGSDAADLHQQDLKVRLVASQSTLTDRYQRWESRYQAAGGDRDVEIRLGWALGLSKADYTRARAVVRVNLLNGQLEAEAEGMEGPADLWLVDNQEGESASPQPGDRMVRVGAIEPGAPLTAELGEDFFDRFMIDLAVVTRAGESPVEGSVLFGSRSLFERLHTRQRMAAEAEESSALRALVDLLAPAPARASSSDILVAKNLVSQLVADGGDLFFRGTFQGNGRTCGTCHPVVNNQTIDLPFIQSLPSDDPLFVAEFPPEEGGVPGLEVPELLRGFGLIVENLDGAEDPLNKFVMRGVPHSLSMDTSVEAPADGREPLERTGWSGDGAPVTGELRFFSMGAVFQHFTRSLDRVEGTDFVFPTDAELDAMEAFMRSVGRVPAPDGNELDLTTASFADAGAERGRTIFLNQGKCNGCHGNASAISAFGGNRNFDTGVEKLDNPAQDVVSFPLDGGFGTADFDCDMDGVDDCFGDGTFNTVGLVEIADTPPFFHNNVVQTVEGAVAFYNGPEFNNSPAGALVGGVSLTQQEVDDVAALLRVLNAAFNIDIAAQRTAAARSLENSSNLKTATLSTSIETDDVNGTKETANTLLALANIEAADAVEVLDARGLHPAAVQDLLDAIAANEEAILTDGSKKRASLMDKARAELDSARAALGSGIVYTMGEANLMF